LRIEGEEMLALSVGTVETSPPDGQQRDATMTIEGHDFLRLSLSLSLSLSVSCIRSAGFSPGRSRSRATAPRRWP